MINHISCCPVLSHFVRVNIWYLHSWVACDGVTRISWAAVRLSVPGCGAAATLSSAQHVFSPAQPSLLGHVFSPAQPSQPSPAHSNTRRRSKYLMSASLHFREVVWWCAVNIHITGIDNTDSRRHVVESLPALSLCDESLLQSVY